MSEATTRPRFAHLDEAWLRWKRGEGRRYQRFDYDAGDDGWPALTVLYMHVRGKETGFERRAWSLGWNARTTHYSILLQRYEAMEFPLHTDLDPKRGEHNNALIVVLRRARRGGEFMVNGPHQRWLGGRVWRLDAGQVEHGFSRIERGSRWSLMFQRAWSDSGLRPR